MSGIPQPARQPSLRLVIDNAILEKLLDVHTGLPARVVTWDPSLQLMDVKPLVQRMAADPNGDVTVTPLPIITSVPFVFPGNGTFGVTWPVLVGDFVWLTFSEAALDGYMQSGQDSVPIDAGRFGVNGAVATPGPRPRNAPLPTPDATAIVIGQHGTLAQYVALANKVDAMLVALKGVLTAAAAVPPTPAPTNPDAFSVALYTALNTLLGPPPYNGWPSSVASTTVKASQ